MSDLIGVVEAVYRPESSHQAWLQGLAQAIRPLLDDGLGTAAWSIRWSDDQVTPQFFATEGMALALRESMLIATAAETPEMIRDCHAAPVSTLRRQMGAHYDSSPSRAFTEPHGMRDMLAVVALNANGSGIGVGVPLRRPLALTKGLSQRWGRVAAHLAAGLRLRRGVEAALSHADAVLQPDGRIEHVADAAADGAEREGLRRAAVAIDKARGSARASDADGALAAWTALVQGRWSLVDHFDTDGRRYLLARRNPVVNDGPAALSERQRQILALRAAGHPLKMIAYELGFSISTVALDLSRGLRALGLRSADELTTRLNDERPS